MSSGHRARHSAPSAKRTQELRNYINEPKFKTALAKYTQADEKRDIPYLGGSSEDGTTVYYDKKLASARFPYDPRPYLKMHETVEGVLIRLYGLPYETAHDLATTAERQAVEAAGHNWKQYSDMLHPFIQDDEHEEIKNPPDDILLLPYKDTPLFDKMRDGRTISQAEAHYRDKPNEGQRCKACVMFKSPDRCDFVEGDIMFNGWCLYWEGK